ncbi:E3 ubiquitin/ISG15 ligase TRIM25-like [Astyanax mexicanus]|uniref:E3 ubiquitin/ISG15 ligase TRIM25-like n=1 Tax=Astyanax mexicanus TaxID=7994 RepID=A0A8T2MD00_ASTMX|nr:E3 ubiquitin/ISG15 ligase TRIM25-like [Astyanax mexicanus]
MAQASAVFLEQDQFNCSICLDVLKDPVTVPCGHSYCRVCLKGYWDQDDYLGIYGCPQCRQSFAPRPVLGRNTMLADVVDRLKKTGLGSPAVPAAPPAPLAEPTAAEPGDVACDVCTGRRNRACRSCLVCLASYCETHLKPHYESQAFQKHRLVPPARGLQDSLCPRHDKLLEVFCRTDQHCICYLCLTDEHKAHDTVLASLEMTEKKVTAVEDDSERICTKLIRSIERRHGELKELVRAEGRAALVQAEGLLERLEQQIEDHRRRESELEQLSQTEDHIHFLQVAAVHLLQSADCCEVTLDPNTANSYLSLSEGNRRVSTGHESQNYPDHPERFTSLAQVLGKEGLSGRSYWEVEWSGNGGITIGVAYKGIVRNSGGTDSKLGCNSKSWSLDLADGLCTFQHNKTKLEIPTPISPRIGVYLDHKTGTLAFYCVSPRGDTMTLLHRVQTTFSQPLYPGFWVGLGSTLKVCPIFNFTA